MGNGRELGVDLHELWYAGRNLLPPVAEQFHVAHGALSSGSSSSPAFRSGGIGTEGSWGAGSAIRELGDVLEEYVAQTYNNIYYVGQALMEQAEDYARTDDEARAVFEQRKRETEEIS